MKGQLSAEMLILIVVVLAIVAIAASQLMKTSEKTAGKIDQTAGELFNKTDAALKGKAGEVCAVSNDCISDSCVDYRCKD